MTSSRADEYLVCVPKHSSKQYNVMRFNAGDKIDIRKWVKGSLSRDLSAKKIYEEEEVYPEYGEGSEYGRKQREEARRLKYGFKRSKFKVKDQPWNLMVSAIEPEADSKKKLNGKSDIKPKVMTKEFSGRKEGGIGEGSMYFVFTQRPDCTFEAHPVEDWYNFKRKIRHRTLTDEEAEEAWEKRDKILNHLNYMARKRLHINDEEEGGGEEGKIKSENKKSSNKMKNGDEDLMIHDNEDYELYMSGGSSDDAEEDDEGTSSKKKQKKKSKQKKESDDEKNEAVEDSDDGEHEGTEIAYASDISSENEEIYDSKIAPRGLDELSSSSSSDDEEENNKPEEKNAEKSKQSKATADSDNSDLSAESASDLEDEDSLSRSALLMQQKKISPKDKKAGKRSASNSRSSTPTSELSGSPNVKRKLHDVSKKLEVQASRQSPLTVGGSNILGKRCATGVGSETSGKRQKTNPEGSGTSTPTRDSTQHGITEEAVRKYLTHKPITTKDLLKKFKAKKKTGITSEQIVDKVAKILKKLNPQKIMMGDKMHLYLKLT
ncbi:unnamed protein product [Clavelina lepadiformis]|uniref:Transcription initiation factor IIF subunit alpha n=1 Tax=Clavelina lepadiformis TaxID=159417 RepID=A0ABP0GHK5_CLALP